MSPMLPIQDSTLTSNNNLINQLIKSIHNPIQVCIIRNSILNENYVVNELSLWLNFNSLFVTCTTRYTVHELTKTIFRKKVINL